MQTPPTTYLERMAVVCDMDGSSSSQRALWEHVWRFFGTDLRNRYAEYAESSTLDMQDVMLRYSPGRGDGRIFFNEVSGTMVPGGIALIGSSRSESVRRSTAQESWVIEQTARTFLHRIEWREGNALDMPTSRSWKRVVRDAGRIERLTAGYTTCGGRLIPVDVLTPSPTILPNGRVMVGETWRRTFPVAQQAQPAVLKTPPCVGVTLVRVLEHNREQIAELCASGHGFCNTSAFGRMGNALARVRDRTEFFVSLGTGVLLAYSAICTFATEGEGEFCTVRCGLRCEVGG